MKIQGPLIFLIILLLMSVSVRAANGGTSMPDGYEDIKNFIPEDIYKLLPEGLFSNEHDKVIDAADELTNADYVLSFASRLINLEIKSSLRLLFILSGALMLCALINAVNSKTLQGAGEDISKFICNILIVCILLVLGTDVIELAEVFFSRINLFMTGMIPFMCTLCAMGGGIHSAVVINYGISAFLGISEIALSKTFAPIAGACIGLSSVGAIGENSAGSSLLQGLKKLYVFLIGMLMSLMLFVFSARGIMSHSADTLGGRAIKFAAGSFIPIVGANIGDILKGVGSGFTYIKSTVGVIAIFLILLMILPTLVSVLVRRLVFSICSAIADLIGAKEQGKIINEFSSVYGMLLAVISMSSVLFIGAVIISVKIGSASA